MRNGDALTEAGRAQRLSGDQAVDDIGPNKAALGLEQRSHRVEQPRLGAGVEVEQDVGSRQEVGNLVH